MSEEVRVGKAKFDSLLQKMLATPPLPKSDLKVAKPKPKVKKSAASSGA